MAELIGTPRTSLEGLSLPCKVGIVAVREAEVRSRFIIRGTPEHLATALPVPLPTEPCRAVHREDCAALWLGPDEWLLLVPSEMPAPRAEGPASCVEVSHRDCGLIVEGPSAAGILNAGCPLDLDLAAFPVGMVVRTLFGKAEVVLWRTAVDQFRVEALRSFAPYIAALLMEASRDWD